MNKTISSFVYTEQSMFFFSFYFYEYILSMDLVFMYYTVLCFKKCFYTVTEIEIVNCCAQILNVHVFVVMLASYLRIEIVEMLLAEIVVKKPFFKLHYLISWKFLYTFDHIRRKNIRILCKMHKKNISL